MGAWGRGSSWHVCGESVLVGVQRPAKITAVDVVRAPQRGWFISVPWLKCVHLTAAVTVGGTSESKQGDRRVRGVSPFPACLYPKGKQEGSWNLLSVTYCQGRVYGLWVSN